MSRFQGLLAVLIVVGSGSLIAAGLLYIRSTAADAGAGLTQSIAAVMAEQSSRTVQVVDQKMGFIAEELRQLGQDGLLARRSSDELLRGHLVGLPFVRALWVLDASGRIIADSDRGNIGVSLADRDYFRAYKTSPGTRFFLGAPVRSRSIGTWLISAAYPLHDSRGVLIGVLAAAVEPPYFESLWGGIDLGEEGRIELYRNDGTLMASSMSPKAALGVRTSDPAVTAAILGTAKGEHPPLLLGRAEHERMVTGERLRHYPQLTLVAQRSWREMLAPWRQFGTFILAIWAVASAGVFVLHSRLQRTWLQRHNAVEALAVSEEKFSAAFRASPDAIMLTRAADGVFVEVSDSVTRITGYAREDLIGRSSIELDVWVNPAERERYVEQLKANGQVSNAEADFRMRTGEIRTGQMSGELLLIGGQMYILGIIRDVTEMKRREDLIWNQAHFDSLTMLPNRAMFVNRLHDDISAAQAGGGAFTLLLIDLDEFKEVNDTLGHEKGDNLLVQVAQRITQCVPPGATVARLGGDEFAIILPGTTPPAHTETLLNALIHGISSPYTLGLDRVFVSGSVGVAPFPAAGTTIAELLRHADQAMYAAKQAGRNRYFYFHRGLQEAALERSSMIKDMRAALANGEFEVYFQPIVSLRTRRICKAEALLRWTHPARGAVSPAEFIPLAESSGLIQEIGEWVFHQSIAQVKRLRDAFDPAFQVSINVSPVQIHSDKQLIGRWIDMLKTANVDPESICIEITEGVLLDLTRGADDTLQAFSDAGVKLALDDFGTGYSSLSYLRKFNIDYLKIDRAFVKNVETNSDDLALCEAIVAMAHKLGLKVIVEAIETPAQLAVMQSMNCEFGQGFLFSKAVTASELEAQLLTHQLR